MTFPKLPPELAKIFRESLLRDINRPSILPSLMGPPGSDKPIIVLTDPVKGGGGTGGDGKLDTP